jgi:hypothetical protein
MIIIHGSGHVHVSVLLALQHVICMRVSKAMDFRKISVLIQYSEVPGYKTSKQKISYDSKY